MNRTPNLPQIRLLGGFELRSGDGRDVAPAGRKVRALAACLALSPGQPCIVKTRIRAWASNRRICSIASMPPRPGIEISMMTTSGCVSL